MLKISASPHITDSISTRKIMLLVIIALLPSLTVGIVMFGLRALLLTLVCVVASVAFEGICRIIMKRRQTISDLSAAVTGFLLAMNLPSTLPLWQAIIGCFIAVVIAKQLFGGLGQNFANPAILARIVLMLSFTSDMTTWSITRFMKGADGTVTTGATSLLQSGSVETGATSLLHGDSVTTGATPLVTGNASYTDLLLGNTGGCIGEVCALALIIGGIFLIAMKVISPVTPLAFIGSLAALELIAGNDPIYQVLSGGLLLGAFFMATDYVTTPITSKGKLIFGLGCGIITFVIRQFGSYPEGVSFSILLMNILTPYIDRFTMTKPLGASEPVKENA